jgi:O-antigen/teichoic acid export membrane protein
MESKAAGAPERENADAATHPLSGRFLFNINFVFVVALISNTLGFGVAILLARALGPDGRGVVALYQAAVVIGFAFVNLGVGPAAFYYVARRELTARQAMEAGLSVSLAGAAVAALGVAITALFFEDQLEGRAMPYGLIVLTLPIVLQLRLAEFLLRAEGRFGAMNTLELGLPVSMAC